MWLVDYKYDLLFSVCVFSMGYLMMYGVLPPYIYPPRLSCKWYTKTVDALSITSLDAYVRYGNPRISARNYCNIWESIGIHGNLWESSGVCTKSPEIPGKSQGILISMYLEESWGISRNLEESRGSQGILRILEEARVILRNLWESLRIFRSLWESLGFAGILKNLEVVFFCFFLEIKGILGKFEWNL